ncbi:MAG: ATP-binding protein [Anaerolineae bacterium]|nr:ATP-binding protein [Anaerolineae bacterium]
MGRNIRLLLVEDMAADALLLRAELMQTSLRFEIDHVQRVAHAVERLLVGGQYDVVLLDLSLPDSRGLDTLRRVREVDPHVPVVILSGYEDAQIGLEAVKNGAQDYLMKGRADAALLERALQYAMERAASIAELTESRRRYHELFDATLEAIFVHVDGDIVDVNRSCEVMFGCERAALVGEELKRFVILEAPLMYDSAGGGQIQQGSARRADGTIFPIEVGSTQIVLDRQAAVLTTIRDVSERLRAEQHALQLTLARERVEMLREFLHAASHDLRTPVTTLLTGMYLIQRNLTDLNQWAKRLQQIVEDLLDMERLERLDFLMARTDVNFVAKSVVERFRAAASERRVWLTCDVAQVDLVVPADAVELGNAAAALVDNAVRYTPAGGYVMVATRQEHAMAVLEVRDTGSGIDPEHLPYIFDRFYRVDPARSTQAGMGLGLAKVKLIVEAHRGRVEVESRVGEGSTFRLVLPMQAMVGEGVS